MNKSRVINTISILLLFLTFLVFLLIPSLRVIEKTMLKTEELNSIYRSWMTLKTETVFYIISEKGEEDRKRFIRIVTAFDKKIEYLLDEEIIEIIDKNYAFVRDNQGLFLKNWQEIQFNLVLVVSGFIGFDDFAAAVLWLAYNADEFDIMLESLIDSSSAFHRQYFKRYIASIYVLSLAVVVIFFLLYLKNREYMYAKKAEKRIRSISQSLDVVRDRERKRIALDLHDTLVHKLSEIKSKCCDSYYQDKNIKSVFKGLRSRLDSVIKLTREISFNLRPVELSGNYFEAIRCYLADFSERTGIKTSFISHGFNRLELSEEIEISIFRMIQEILNNTEKHSKAGRLSVKYLYSFPYIILNIEDDGIGISEPLINTGDTGIKQMGLKGIRDRVELLNGTFTIKAKENKGVKIFIKIPYHIKTGSEVINA